MGTVQKILTMTLWGLLVLIMLSVVGAGLWRENRDRRAANSAAGNSSTGFAATLDGMSVSDATAAPGPLMFDVPPFALVDQNGNPVTRESLRGRPWVAAFIFTRCPTGVCPMMAARLGKLQDAIDPRVRLVSFSVDPERDTPEVLRRYAASFGADGERWSLLTGDKATIYAVADAMKVAVMPAPTPERPDDITHSDRFILVDADGKVRQTYRSNDEDAMAKLQQDVRELLAPETSSPARATAPQSVPTH
jgi:cytochrome oxidase Cu insertion factor (SCO1/SenC/PrrC family)